MPLLGAVGMTPTGKNFTIETALIWNEQAMTYRWVSQQIKHLYFSSVVSTEKEQDGNTHELCVIITDRESGLMPVIEETLKIGGDHPCSQEKDIDSEMHDLVFLLDKISTGSISKVTEMRRLEKGVLSPVLPEDLGMTLTSAPESSGFGLGSGFGSGSGSGLGSRGRGRPPWAPRGRGRGRSSRRSSLSLPGSVIDPSTSSTFLFIDTFPSFMYPFIENWKNVKGHGSCEYRVVADFLFDDEHQWPEVRKRICFELEHMMTSTFYCLDKWNEHWLDTPNSLYVIANAFNWCVVLIAQIGSMTVLPLYLYSDRIGGTLLQMQDECTLPLYTCNGNIIVVIELVVGQSLILTGFQIGTRDMLEHIHQEILFMLTFSCFCN
ncbi:hypothetical protein M9H77_31455 [Catharanthus roseus]|uniref:Uncharacterized protein n=1 Tax=Catharanthus roseus TaxID=4058 RepID=A0ACC0A059_CATRO|nr:hypothetical protein M9H77_31455 [Catharanthus roseus]